MILVVLALFAAGSYYLVQANSDSRSLGGISPLGASSQTDSKQANDDDDDDCEPNGGYGQPPECKKKVKICHRTASNKNPYVLITVNRNSLKAHRNHPPKNGRRDIIPAPAQGCPSG